MRFSNSITIQRSAGDVFAYLAGFENLPGWNYAISQVHKITPGPPRVGSRYLQVRTLPTPSEETFEISQFEPDRRLAVEGAFGPLSGQATYLLEPTGDATTLTNQMRLQPRGVLRVVAPLATPRVQAAVAENLRKLKEILEQPRT